MCLLHGAEGSPPYLTLGGAAVRQLACRRPGRIGLHRAATADELAQHRVVDPHPGEKPGTDLAALRSRRPQRPRPHMRGCVLRAFPRAGLAHRHCGRCRGHAVGLTHSTTVEVTTDTNVLPPQPPQRVAAARAHLVFVTKYRCKQFTDAVLTYTEHTSSTPTWPDHAADFQGSSVDALQMRREAT